MHDLSQSYDVLQVPIGKDKLFSATLALRCQADPQLVSNQRWFCVHLFWVYHRLRWKTRLLSRSQPLSLKTQKPPLMRANALNELTETLFFNTLRWNGLSRISAIGNQIQRFLYLGSLFPWFKAWDTLKRALWKAARILLQFWFVTEWSIHYESAVGASRWKSKLLWPHHYLKVRSRAVRDCICIWYLSL